MENKNAVTFEGGIYSPFLTTRLPSWAGVRQNVVGSSMDGYPVLPSNAASMRYETVGGAGALSSAASVPSAGSVFPADPVYGYTGTVTLAGSPPGGFVPAPAAAAAATAVAEVAGATAAVAALEERVAVMAAGLNDLTGKMDAISDRVDLNQRTVEGYAVDLQDFKRALNAQMMTVGRIIDSLQAAVTALLVAHQRDAPAPVPAPAPSSGSSSTSSSSASPSGAPSRSQPSASSSTSPSPSPGDAAAASADSAAAADGGNEGAGESDEHNEIRE